MEAFCIQLCYTLKGCIPCCLPEFFGLPRLPCLLCAAKGIQHGQRAATGTLTLLQSEIIAMNRAAREKGYKDILDVDVDILISYIPEDSTAITVDQIICASFSELPSGMKAGDMKSEHAMPFVALDIDYDIAAK